MLLSVFPFLPFFVHGTADSSKYRRSTASPVTTVSAVTRHGVDRVNDINTEHAPGAPARSAEIDLACVLSLYLHISITLSIL